MLREQARKLYVGTLLADSVVTFVTFLLAVALRNSDFVRYALDLQPVQAMEQVLLAALAAAVMWPTILRFCGAYDSHRRDSFVAIARVLGRATLIGVVSLLGVAFGLQLDELSRLVVAIFGVLSFGALLITRLIVLSVLRVIRRRGLNCRSVVVLGTGPRARRVAERIESNPGWGLNVVGFADDEPAEGDRLILGDRYRGPLRGLVDLLREREIDEVVFALPRRYLGAESTANAIALCEIFGIDFTLATDLFDTRSSRPVFHELLGTPCITLGHARHGPGWRLGLKRTIDILGALAVLIVSAPVWVAAAIAIKLDSPGPVLFIQTRSGRGNRTFPCIKFRTMYADAEQRREELLERNEVSGPVFKMENDPRVTPVGRVLRRYSIDELPQLVNVVLGHMSLVGPRPPLPSEVDEYEPDQLRRLSVRPGMTGLWQVSGRTRIPFEDWVRLDLQYIDEWSLFLDLQIMLATIPAVWGGEGAS